MAPRSDASEYFTRSVSAVRAAGCVATVTTESGSNVDAIRLARMPGSSAGDASSRRISSLHLMSRITRSSYRLGPVARDSTISSRDRRCVTDGPACGRWEPGRRPLPKRYRFRAIAAPASVVGRDWVRQ